MHGWQRKSSGDVMIAPLTFKPLVNQPLELPWHSPCPKRIFQPIAEFNFATVAGMVKPYPINSALIFYGCPKRHGRILVVLEHR